MDDSRLRLINPAYLAVRQVLQGLRSAGGEAEGESTNERAPCRCASASNSSTEKGKCD
jgi:hypothetical protein